MEVTMKKIYKYSAISFALLFMFLAGHAQQRVQLKLGYNINTPTGSAFENLVNKTSFRGVNAELSYPLSNQLSIGLGVAYSDFYQKYPRKTFETKDGTISAVLSNSIQTTPVLAKVNYQLTKAGLIRPYLGAGAGFNVVRYSHYLGEFPGSKTSFKPALGADAGVNIPFFASKQAGLNLGVNFNYLPYDNDIAKNLNNWGVHAGVFFPLR